MAPPTLLFVRHGATQPNLEGRRCGGDVDVPMAPIGTSQVSEAAAALRAAGWPIDLIVASDLQRTRDSARIVSESFGGVPISIDADWRERALGAWNLRPIHETEAALRAGDPPPGGETGAAFTRRIEQALDRLVRHTQTSLPLLIGSKGVARVLSELLGVRQTAPVGNGEWLSFDLAPLYASARARAPRAAAVAACPAEACS